MKENQEAKVIGKVLQFINSMFPKELKKANKEYQNTQEAKMTTDKALYYRGFLSYFLIQRMINGATPMEYAYSLPLNYFSNVEKTIIQRFINHTESLFEIKLISKNRKNFLIIDVTNNKKYSVITLDFPDILKEHDIIRALIVKKTKQDYFFYGNVWSYNKQEALKTKMPILLEIKEKRKIPKIEWDIRYTKNQGKTN